MLTNATNKELRWHPCVSRITYLSLPYQAFKDLISRHSQNKPVVLASFEYQDCNDLVLLTLSREVY